MAGAVLNDRFVSGVAPLVIFFLIVFGLVVFIAGCALLAKAVHRYRDTDLDAPDLTDPVHPGDVYAWLNQRVADDPELAAGTKRLRAAIRDQQQKEAGDA